MISDCLTFLIEKSNIYLTHFRFYVTFSPYIYRVNLANWLFVQVTPVEDKSLSPSTTPSEIVVKTGSNMNNDIDVSTTDHMR
jgi:hypothetical protein